MASKRTTKTPVSAKRIRVAFQTNERGLDATKVVDAKGKAVSTNAVLGRDGDTSRIRGRLNPAQVAAFLEAFPEHTYAEIPKGGVSSNQKTVEVPRVGKNGRALKPATISLAEARRLSGTEGKKGRLSADDLARAGAALV